MLVPSDCEPVPPAKAGGEGAEFVIAVFASRIGSSADVHGEADKLRELFRNMEHVSFELLAKPSARPRIEKPSETEISSKSLSSAARSDLLHGLAKWDGSGAP